MYPKVVSKGKERKGRGFSLEEIKLAGLTLKDAKKLGIYIDKRRKTCYQENVEYLKKIKENAK